MTRRSVTSMMTSRDSTWRHNRNVILFKVVVFGN